MLSMARKGDPNLKIKIPSIDKALVHCSDYTPSCRLGYIAVIYNLELKILYYEDQTKALKAAKRIKGYVVRNWVLDEVNGEPILEKFAKKYLSAQLASEVK